MRNLILSVVALPGCAASAQAVEAAKAVRYRGDKLVLFDAATAATAAPPASEPPARVTPP